MNTLRSTGRRIKTLGKYAAIKMKGDLLLRGQPLTHDDLQNISIANFDLLTLASEALERKALAYRHNQPINTKAPDEEAHRE